jgi:regulatory protein
LSAGFEEPEVMEALAGLEAAGLVEDGRFARELVRHQAGRRMAGDRAIREALRAKGVPSDLAEEAVREAGDEWARAQELALRQERRLSHLTPEVAYRRLFGLLTRRGYSFEVARAACVAALRAREGEAFEDDSASD